MKCKKNLYIKFKKIKLKIIFTGKKDNKLPNTKNVKKKNADGSVQAGSGGGKKGKRGGGGKKAQAQQQQQSEVKMEMFKDDDFHSIL